MQDFDHAGFAAVLMVERFLADYNCVRAFDEKPAQFPCNLEQDLAVALILG